MNDARVTTTIQLPEVERRTLDNGLRVLAVRDSRLPLLTIVLMIGVGAEADEEGKAGQADLTLEMLTLGTVNRTSEEIALAIDSLGARLGYHARWDASFIEVEGLSEDLRAMLDILSDLVLRPSYPPSEFDQLKERRIAALVQEQDESEVVADLQLTQLVFGGTPYGHPRRGTVDSVRMVSLEDLKTFHDQHVLPDRCVLMVAGDVDAAEAFQTAEACLGSLKKGSTPYDAGAFSVPRGAERRIRLVHRPDLTQSQIRLGHLGIERTSPEHETFQLGNYILGGGGFSSRLMERVRSQKGYTYGISSSFKGRRYPGPFVISTFTPNQTTVAVVEEVLQVVEEFVRYGVTPTELEEARSFYLGSYPFRFETPGKIASEILEVELYGLGLESLIEYPRTLSRITQKDVERLARLRFFPEALGIVIVGNCDGLREPMEKLGPVEAVDFQTLVK